MRWMMLGGMTLGFGLLWTAPAAAQLDDGEDAAAAAWKAADAGEGGRLFRALCAGCHGRRGDGRGPVAARLDPRPRDLTRGEYRFRSTKSGALPTRDDMLRTLRLGLPGTAMPSWGEQLDARQLRGLVLYLETLSDRFALEERDEDHVLVEPDDVEEVPEVTPAWLARGAALYVELKCGDCHGPGGRGDGPSAGTQTNSDGTPAHVFDFTAGTFKGGDAPGDVYRTFTTGLDGSPMPAFDASVPKAEDRWALVHFVRSLRRDRGLWYYLSERPTWTDP
jgi:mono/diheme cytochrome c family protein